MAQAFIGLGSNLGDGCRNLLRAWEYLHKRAGTGLALSSPFLTEPVNMDSDNLFTNAVGMLETELSPRELLFEMLAIEQEMGRDRLKGKDRTVDLDLLYYDDKIMNADFLVLPHPEIVNRLFVLAPLGQIAPDHVHPVLQMTTSQMLERQRNGSAVKCISWEQK